MTYLWIKAFHIIAVIAWMAGMLYLPRLFVYHAGVAPGSEQSETFKVMERRLLKAIINPAMASTWLLGLWLWSGWATVQQSRLASCQVRSGDRACRRCTANSSATGAISPPTGTGTARDFTG